MSRNVSILIIILVVVLIAGYLVWLRSRFQAPKEEIVPTQQVVELSPSPTQQIVSPSPTTSPTTTPSVRRSATGSAKTTR